MSNRTSPAPPPRRSPSPVPKTSQAASRIASRKGSPEAANATTSRSPVPHQEAPPAVVAAVEPDLSRPRSEERPVRSPTKAELADLGSAANSAATAAATEEEDATSSVVPAPFSADEAQPPKTLESTMPTAEGTQPPSPAAEAASPVDAPVAAADEDDDDLLGVSREVPTSAAAEPAVEQPTEETALPVEEEPIPEPEPAVQEPDPDTFLPEGASLAACFGDGFLPPHDDDDIDDAGKHDLSENLESAFGLAMHFSHDPLQEVLEHGHYADSFSLHERIEDLTHAFDERERHHNVSLVEQEIALDASRAVFGTEPVTMELLLDAADDGGWNASAIKVVDVNRPGDALEQNRVKGSETWVVDLPVVYPNRQILHTTTEKFDPGDKHFELPQANPREVFTTQNIIRCAEIKSKNKVLSNARIVTWSNGTATIHIGSDQYDIADNADRALMMVAKQTLMDDGKSFAMVDAVPNLSRHVALRPCSNLPNSVDQKMLADAQKVRNIPPSEKLKKPVAFPPSFSTDKKAPTIKGATEEHVEAVRKTRLKNPPSSFSEALLQEIDLYEEIETAQVEGHLEDLVNERKRKEAELQMQLDDQRKARLSRQANFGGKHQRNLEMVGDATDAAHNEDSEHGAATETPSRVDDEHQDSDGDHALIHKSGGGDDGHKKKDKKSKKDKKKDKKEKKNKKRARDEDEDVDPRKLAEQDDDDDDDVLQHNRASSSQPQPDDEKEMSDSDILAHLQLAEQGHAEKDHADLEAEKQQQAEAVTTADE